MDPGRAKAHEKGPHFAGLFRVPYEEGYNLNMSPPRRLLAFTPIISKAIGMAAIVRRARKKSSPLPVGGMNAGGVGVGSPGVSTGWLSLNRVGVAVAAPGTKGVSVGTGVLVGVGTGVFVETTTVLLGTGVLVETTWVFVGGGVWITLVAVGLGVQMMQGVLVLVGVSSTTRLGRGVTVGLGVQ